MATMDRIKLRHLHSLVAVSEQGSLVRAADALSVTQPAVSKTLAELEDIVGQRLFERGPRGVVLTDVGQQLLRYAGSSLRTLREGLDSIARDRSDDSPILLLGAAPNASASVLPQALQAFALQAPNARVRVRTGSNAQLIADLRRDQLDLVLGRLVDPSAMQGLSFEPLYTEVLIFAVRAGHPLAARRRLRPEELAGYIVVLPDLGTRIREAADRYFLASGAALPTQVVETIDASFGRSYVLQGDAVWCVPEGAVEHDLRQGTLCRLRLDTSITEGSVGLTMRADMVASRTLQLLLQEIRKNAARRARATT
ncbi:MAG TPA: pca operon transcription factor PcaQ [Ramlibacter sp.]|nr:pca operon transcription factor PcaQ [Ramlibacter sp.]